VGEPEGNRRLYPARAKKAEAKKIRGEEEKGKR